MSLDRDELAARCLVARLSALNAAGAYRANADAIAENAIDCTDALLARLRPEAVAPAPSRPEWVRITGPKDAVNVTVGKAYRVIYVTDEGNLAINNDEGVARHLPRRGEYVTRVFPSWEPCAAPSPAATPAAWVPSVGDVIVVPYSHHPAPEWTKIVVSVGDETVRYESRNSLGEVLRPYGFCAPWECVFVRPATSSERAAAGLPVDESATKPVDREGLAKAIYEAVRAGNLLTGARKWDDVPMVVRNDSLNAADAAIAYLKANGGVA